MGIVEWTAIYSYKLLWSELQGNRIWSTFGTEAIIFGVYHEIENHTLDIYGGTIGHLRDTWGP